MNPEIIEKIEQYLDDEMQPQERKDFEIQLSTDDELRNTFELYKSINKTMNPKPDENELRRTLQQMNNKYFTEGGNVRQGLFKKWLAVAAAVIVIAVGAAYFLLPGKPAAGKLYARFAEHTPLNIQLRGSTADSLAQKAATAFNEKEYNTAKLLLEQYVQLQPDDAQMKFSLAECYLETENYSQAERIFLSIAQGQTAYSETAKWWLALSALKQKDFAKCRNNLKSIPQASPYFTKAKELLEKLPD